MSQKLDKYIEGVGHLPPAPGVLVKLIGLFRLPDREVDEIVGLLTQDPSLTAEVLRHCNSAAFGHEEPIVDIFDAIMRLGFYEVYQLALAMFGERTLNFSQAEGGINVRTLWAHSAATAVFAGAIAKRVGESEGLAFTAGLLHDVGKIVLASAEGEAYAELSQEHGHHGAQLQEAETIKFGFGHGEVGARLLQRWGVPEDISVPVRWHHHTNWVEPYERLCAVVALANWLTRVADIPPAEIKCDSSEAVTAAMTLSLTEDDVVQLLQDSQEDVARFTGLLHA